MVRAKRSVMTVAAIAAAAMLAATACAGDETPMADTGPTATARSVTATAVGQDTGAVPTPKQLRFSQPPPLAIDQNKRYFATIDIAGKGKVRLELYPKKAPITVNSFVFLARQGFYDGVSFHRVIAGFVAQGGDPTGTGSGGPGYQFVNESSDLRHTRGALSMANSGPNTNGSQFYICLADQPGLDGSYTVFGQVVEGMDVVLSIKLRDPQQSPNAPAGDRMRSVTIQEQ